MKVQELAITQLTAPGDADSIQMGSVQPASGQVEVTIATIDTSIDVNMEYSNTSDFASSVTGPVEQFTANGSYVLPMAVGYRYARLVFADEVGGTAATVDAVYKTFY